MHRQEVDLIVAHAAEIATPTGRDLHPAFGPQQCNITVIHDGAIAIRNGIIVKIGKTREILSAYRSKHVIDASDKTMLPGLVDPPTHHLCRLQRHRIRDETQREILHGNPRRRRRNPKHGQRDKKDRKAPAFRNLSQESAIIAAARTTTIEAKSGYGLTTAEEIKCLQVARALDKAGPFDVVPTFLGAHAIPEEYEKRADEYVDLVVEEMIPEVAEKKLARFGDVFCEKGAFTIEQSRRILKAAQRLELKPKIHADEFFDTGGAALAAEIGAVSADHRLCSSDTGLKEMANKGTVADWQILNALLNAVSGATWIPVHHGGGVGIGYSIHAGMCLVADGTELTERKILNVLTTDPGIGVVRHADAGYEQAKKTERENNLKMPMLD